MGAHPPLPVSSRPSGEGSLGWQWQPQVALQSDCGLGRGLEQGLLHPQTISTLHWSRFLNGFLFHPCYTIALASAPSGRRV